MIHRRSIAGALLAFCLALPLPALAQAQYPERLIRVVVPYAAGGSTDIAARLIFNKMAEQARVPVVIENRPGGGGNLGASQVARVAGDGYTVLFTGPGIALTPSLKSIPFDFKKDFVPVSMAVYSQFSILASPRLPVASVAELISYAKANPGKLNVAAAGLATANHLAIELLKTMAGIDVVVVQYNGNAPANTAVLSGEPPIGIDAAYTAKGLVSSGQLRVLAVTGAKRSPLMPEVPTVAESGVPGYKSGFWLGMFAPSSTPRETVAKLAELMAAAVKDPAVRAKLDEQGMDPIGNSPAEFARQVDDEVVKNGKLIQQLRAQGVIE